MAHTFLMLHLVAIFVGVQVVGTYTSYGGGGADNGHSAKKAPMDYSRYADDVRNIANHHESDFNSHRSNTCDDRFELKNSTIIRTKDSMYSGAQFVDDMKVAGATECRRQCCKKEEKCDTAIFVDDDTKDKNCFLFKCRIDDSIKCKFANHVGYVSAMVGGFEVVPRSRIETESDRGDADNDIQRNEEEGDVKTGFDVKQETAATPEDDDVSNQDEEAVVDDDGCGDGKIQCANGDCIIARYVCNDVEDCTDGSDEMGCKYGSWKHWNNYNHPDSTYPDDDDRDRSDEGVNRESEVDEAVNQDDVDDSNKGNDARQDKRPEDSVLPTEMDNQLSDIDDSQDVPPQSSPEPAVEPVQEVSSNLVDPEGEEGHPSSAAMPTVVNVPKVVGSKTEEGTSKVDDLGDQTLRKVTPHGIQPATSAILPLAVGLIITLFLLMMLSCRLRYMNRRLRYGRLKTHAHDADYLINGMYL